MSGDVLPECGWVGEFEQALEACVLWSRKHGHRHRISWSIERGHWRITCLVPTEADQ